MGIKRPGRAADELYRSEYGDTTVMLCIGYRNLMLAAFEERTLLGNCAALAFFDDARPRSVRDDAGAVLLKDVLPEFEGLMVRDFGWGHGGPDMRSFVRSNAWSAFCAWIREHPISAARFERTAVVDWCSRARTTG